MPLEHIFPTLDAAKATLQQQLPARILIYNTEAASGDAQITAPVAYYRGQSDTLGAGGFPAVELYIGHGDLTHFPTGGAMADVADRVVVIVTDEHGEGEVETLYEKIVGLGRCVIEVLVTHNAFGPGVQVQTVSYDYAIVQQSDPADPLERNPQRYRTSAVLEFRVEGITPTS